MLEKVRIPVQVDIGFGDAVPSDAREEILTTIIGLPAPRLKIYPKETVIVEKFEAVVKFGLSHS